MIDIFGLPIHPQADIFPMLADDEMRELAEDIRTNGLISPIVIGEYGGTYHLIDGRNRREACRIAGVDPEYQEINGRDQTAYIASSNLNRRHMSPSQKAMAMAMLYPGGSGKGANPKDLGLSGEYLRMARKVLKVLPDTAQSVLQGGVGLSGAYQKAKDEAHKNSGVDVRLARIREMSLRLFEMVTAGELTLEGAEAELKQGEIEAGLQRELKIKHFYQLNNISSLLRTTEHIESARELFINHKEDFESYAQQSLVDFLKEVEVVERNIGAIKSIIEESV
jgi:hypothetical protein